MCYSGNGWCDGVGVTLDHDPHTLRVLCSILVPLEALDRSVEKIVCRGHARNPLTDLECPVSVAHFSASRVWYTHHTGTEVEVNTQFPESLSYSVT